MLYKVLFKRTDRHNTLGPDEVRAALRTNYLLKVGMQPILFFSCLDAIRKGAPSF